MSNVKSIKLPFFEVVWRSDGEFIYLQHLKIFGMNAIEPNNTIAH